MSFKKSITLKDIYNAKNKLNEPPFEYSLICGHNSFYFFVPTFGVFKMQMVCYSCFVNSTLDALFYGDSNE